MAAENDDIFLYGDLYLTIFESKNRGVLKTFQSFFTYGTADNAFDEFLTGIPRIIRITVSVAGAAVANASGRKNWSKLVWNEHFRIPLAHLASKIMFKVHDDINVIGFAEVPANKIKDGEVFDESVPVYLTAMRTIPISTIHVRMKFIPCSENEIYSRGVGGLMESYYPLRPEGKVTLYQDAHVIDKTLPKIELDGDIHREHGKCWVDICQAIAEAKIFVYLVGWSIHHNINLVVQPTTDIPGVGDLTLGELLKHKSESGVKVQILLWNDWLGKMKTQCSETREFFKDSSVTCLIVHRNSIQVSVPDKIEGFLYTHHQKCVIVDTLRDVNSRKITAFIGGLDLCAGRFDTPDHQLFPELNYAQHNYCPNPNFPKREMCPRQPWHDLHCRIEGPAASDVLDNFEHRWRRATTPSVSKYVKVFKPLLHDMQKIHNRWWNRAPKAGYGTLLKIKNVPVVIPSSSVSEENDSKNWHVQIFRSIDSYSVDNFPENAQEVDNQNLVMGRDLVATDRSIQMAYIQAIRSARHHIYIENQYFIGSSYAWSSIMGAGANNNVPMELVQKVISKIRDNERFAVYVVIPMWPEGVPETLPVKEVLNWQRRTMEMVYKKIGDELKSRQMVDARPTDYLNFYCLGNRETPPKDTNANGNQSSNGSPRNGKESESLKYGRFMIYVHSKGMIVDDEYVILGSANINERSMSGSRDTEIAMGAYQPHYTWAKMNYPCGEVYGYRMSLWAEHLGRIYACFKDPKSLDCVKKVNSIANDNWDKYTAAEFAPLEGHILKYPIQVEDDGQINHLPGYETFPDVGGKVQGARSTWHPSKRLTT